MARDPFAAQQLVPRPESARVYVSRRRIRLSDLDPAGRLRLDAAARFLQDAAIDDVAETGWGAPGHLWFVRRYRLDVLVPFSGDREVEVATWCAGTAPLAAGRRTSVTGDAGGRLEADSVWIHLDRDARPARIDGFGVYAEAAGDRRVSTKLGLPDPPPDAPRLPWPLRAADVDLHGHVNNAVHLAAVEQVLPDAGVDPRTPFRVLVDYRGPLDLGDPVELVRFSDGGSPALALVAGDVRAVARLEAL